MYAVYAVKNTNHRSHAHRNHSAMSALPPHADSPDQNPAEPEPTSKSTPPKKSAKTNETVTNSIVSFCINATNAKTSTKKGPNYSMDPFICAHAKSVMGLK